MGYIRENNNNTLGGNNMKDEVFAEVTNCLTKIAEGDWTYTDMGEYFYDILGDNILDALEEK